MGHVATREKSITTRKLAESGNKSSITYHNGGRGFAEALEHLFGEKINANSTANS